MSKLQIDQLTEQVQLEKTAEEVQMEKIAAVIQVVDQASVLTAVGEELYKIAEECENESLAALASDIYHTGERMGSALTKLASENSNVLEESFEIAEDLNKLAGIMAEIADDVQDDDFNKLAEAIIDISNEMTEEANEVLETLEKEASEEDEEDEDVEKEAGARTDAAKKAVGDFSKKHLQFGRSKEYLKKTSKGRIGEQYGHGDGKWEQLKYLATHKKGAKAAAKDAAPYAATVAALGGAGYAVAKKKKKD